MHVCVLAPTFTELVKRSKSDGTAGSLPVLVLPGGKSLACSLSLSYTPAVVYDMSTRGLEAVATPKCRHSSKNYAYYARVMPHYARIMLDARNS